MNSFEGFKNHTQAVNEFTRFTQMQDFRDVSQEGDEYEQNEEVVALQEELDSLWKPFSQKNQIIDRDYLERINFLVASLKSIAVAEGRDKNFYISTKARSLIFISIDNHARKQMVLNAFKDIL